MSSPDLIVVGDCNPDLVISGNDVTPEFGQREKLVGAMALMIGGSAAITAVAAARLGLRVALVAAVGDDPAGELMLALLAREQVDVSPVLVRRGSPTGMTAVLSAGSDRAILTSLGAMASLTADDVPRSLLAGARHLHVSSYFLLEDSLGPGLGDLLAVARRHGASTSLDPNYDPAERWGDERLRAALGQVDFFLPNETEALGISGHRDVGPAAAALAELGGSVAIKLGARGALCCPAAGGRRAGGEQPGQVLVSVPPVEPVDTTGAGDCFNAGLIAGLLDGLDLPRAVAVGCAVGAACTSAAGGTGAVVDRAAACQLSARATFALDPAALRGDASGLEQAVRLQAFLEIGDLPADGGQRRAEPACGRLAAEPRREHGEQNLVGRRQAGQGVQGEWFLKRRAQIPVTLEDPGDHPGEDRIAGQHRGPAPRAQRCPSLRARAGPSADDRRLAAVR